MSTQHTGIMESTTKDIHQVLGNLRQRIDELSKGDYSKGYINEMPMVEANINHFAPDTIIKFLSPLVQQLKDISEVVYQKVSDDPHDEINKIVGQGIEVDVLQFRNPTGESKRDLMRKEVSIYIYTLNNYIHKYSKSYPSRKVMMYLIYDEDRGKQNLLNLHNALRDFIEEILPDDFR